MSLSFSFSFFMGLLIVLKNKKFIFLFLKKCNFIIIIIFFLKKVGRYDIFVRVYQNDEDDHEFFVRFFFYFLFFSTIQKIGNKIHQGTLKEKEKSIPKQGGTDEKLG
jgi:hypothetical protein